MASSTVSKVIIEILKSWNVKFLFTGMGSDLLGFLDEIVKEGTIKIVSPRPEASQVFAAIGNSAISGCPSVCIATSGPGVAYMFPAIYAAWKESVPIVCIAPYPHPGHSETHTIKSLEGVKIFPHLTKQSIDCGHIDQITFLLNKAFRVATTPPCGPVILNISTTFFASIIDYDPVSSDKWRPVSNFVYPDPEAIKLAARVLAESEEPMALGDTRLIWNRASRELLELADHLGMPVMCSHVSALRPMIPDTSPLSLGEYPSSPTVAASTSCDCMLLVDCEFDSFVTMGLHSQAGFGKGSLPETLVQIDSDPSMLSMIYPAKAGILANSKIVLAELLKAVKEFPLNKDKVSERKHKIKRIRAKWNEMIESDFKKGSAKTPMSPIVPAMELAKAIPEDAIVSLSGASNSFFYKMLGVSRASVPGSILHFGYDMALGGGLGRAIGAKLASPDRFVAAFLGDGELWYGGISELETISRMNLPILIVVSNNSAMGDDKFVQMIRYGGRYPASDIRNPDLGALANSFGMYGEKVDSANHVGDAIRRAIDSKRPALVDVITDWRDIPSYQKSAMTGDTEGLLTDISKLKEATEAEA